MSIWITAGPKGNWTSSNPQPFQRISDLCRTTTPEFLVFSVFCQAPGSGFSLERAREVQEALLEAMPAGHLEFIRGLDRYHQAGDYLFVHAGVRPGVELPDQSLDDLLWIREYFLEYDQEHQARVVHGHTVTDTVQECKNRIGIDTGAYATGILTCAVIEGSTIRYLDTSSRSKTFENHSA